MSDSPLDQLRKVPILGSAVSEAEAYGRRSKMRTRKPLALYVAQLFLFLIVAVYFTKLSVLIMGMVSGYGDSFANLLTYVIDLLMMFVSLEAVLGISSRRPSSWKKVQRSAGLLFVFSILGMLIPGTSASALVTLSPVFVALICVPMVAIMFLRSVRKYYLPPMHDMPPMGRWLWYAVLGQLFPAERYEIDYGE